MWKRLTITLLLAAMASSSDGESGSCPVACQCNEIPKDHAKLEFTNKTIEVHCTSTTPSVQSLSSDWRRLVVEAADPHEIINTLMNIENEWRDNNNSDNNTVTLALQELEFINCSLTHLNVTLSAISQNLPSTSLNFSFNEFADTESLRIREGERLVKLDLSYNRLTRVRREGFVELTRLSQLSLRKNAIQIVEVGGFAGLRSLEILDISDNRIATIAEDAFVPLCLLQKLDISGNRLGVLGSQWFDSLGRLRELDVSRNEFARGKDKHNKSVIDEKNIDEDEEKKSFGALEALPLGLRVLRVADNPLTDVELSLVLGSGQRLETVDASRIGLDRVPSALTRSVRALTLAGNKLSTIRSGDLDSYPLLRLLDLSNNILRFVEEDALGRLEILADLDLSGNRLSEVPQSLPSSLTRLVLSDNSIEKIAPKDFQGLYKLEKLLLNKNAIIEIEEGSIGQLSLLTELDLSDNPIKQLPANTFGGPRSLAILRMSGLTSLQWEREKRADMAFPVPAPERLVTLDLSRSPALAAQLVADEAALSACKSLRRLNLSRTNLTSLRSDLAYLLPQLHTLGLSDNQWNCTGDNPEIVWLVEWIREHEEMQPPAKCDEPQMRLGIKLVELPIVNSATTSSSTNLPIIQVSTLSLDVQNHFQQDVSKTKANEEKGEEDIVPNQSTTDEIFRSRTNLSHNSINANDGKTRLVSKELTNLTIKKNSSEITKMHRIETNEAGVGAYDINETNERSLSLLKDLDNNIESMGNTVAEELNGSEESSKLSESRASDVALAIGAHPGMFVLIGAGIVAVAALTFVLSRRAASINTQNSILLHRERYLRHENIEVDTLSHQQQQQFVTVTELW